MLRPYIVWRNLSGLATSTETAENGQGGEEMIGNGLLFVVAASLPEDDVEP
jgi:hypothetical protein